MPGSHFAEKLMGVGSAQAEDRLTLLRKCATAWLQLCATIPTHPSSSSHGKEVQCL